MIKAKVNSQSEFVVERDELTNQYLIDGVETKIDIIQLNQHAFHIIKNHQSYNVEIVDADYASKTFKIKINHQIHQVALTNRYDELLHQLGLDKLHLQKVNEIKAPMPGLVKDILVTEGQQLAAGDSVIILEAMKMENVLKCPADAIVKSIRVKKGATVEKNEVMIMLA